jgi:hypothetical protein
MGPPAALVEWTEYLGLLVALIAAVRALWTGGSALIAKADKLRRS